MIDTIRRMTAASLIFVYPIVILAVAWHLLAHSGMVPVRLFPDAWTIGDATGDFIASGDFWYHSQFTLYRTFTAFALAAPTGIVIGILLARVKWAELLFEPLFTFTYPMPKIALLPIFVIVFGFGSPSKIALAFVEATYPVVISTFFGVRMTKRTIIWAAEGMGASQARIFFRVLLPSALPEVLTSFRISLHVAFVVVILLEIIGDSTGLGYYITYSASAFDYAGFFAGILAIMFWGFLLDRIMIMLRTRIVFWVPVNKSAH